LFVGRYDCLSFALSVCLSFALSVCLFVYLSLVVRLSLLSVGLSAVCLSVFLRSFCLSVCLSVCLLVCRSVRSVGLSVAAFVNTELRLCAQIGRRCPRWSCASRIRTTTCPRWTSYFSLFREYHSQSHPRLLIKISQVLRFFKYWSDLVPNNTFV
jgi:hypothetical protein